ncbi:MAG: cobalamin-binding protein [Halanaerobium sp.]|nr:cobalamin-binding protein [Halanaerobium sp.]
MKTIYKSLLVFLLISFLTSPLSSGAAAGEGFTVTDFAGRKVTFTSVPERIISLAPSNTEILFALGAGDKVVGVTTFANYPEEARDKPRVGDVNPNLEKIAIQRPDVIFTMGGMDEVVQKLTAIGYKVVVIDPQKIDDIFQAIDLISRVTATRDRAEELIGELRQRIAAVEEAVRDVENRPSVFYEVWDEPLMTAGPGTFIDSLIKMAGGRNVAGSLQQSWSQYSFERLLLDDPDIYLISWEDKGRVLERPGWSNLQAIKEGQVYIIDQDLISRPGPRIVDALEELARIIHPEAFPASNN